jgi:hypothetical protein
MATGDNTRPSLTNNLESRYKSKQSAGGAFDAKQAGTNTMLKGVQAPYGYTQKSRSLTIEPGFTTGMNTSRRENFTDKALNTTGLYRVGDTTKYLPK